MFVSGQEVGCSPGEGTAAPSPHKPFSVPDNRASSSFRSWDSCTCLWNGAPFSKKKKCSFCSPEHRALLQPCELTSLWGQGAATHWNSRGRVKRKEERGEEEGPTWWEEEGSRMRDRVVRWRPLATPRRPLHPPPVCLCGKHFFLVAV